MCKKYPAFPLDFPYPSYCNAVPIENIYVSINACYQGITVGMWESHF